MRTHFSITTAQDAREYTQVLSPKEAGRAISLHYLECNAGILRELNHKSMRRVSVDSSRVFHNHRHDNQGDRKEKPKRALQTYMLERRGVVEEVVNAPY